MKKIVPIIIRLSVLVSGILIFSSVSAALDLLPYIIPENENFRVYSRLKKPDGGTADEVFSYRDGGWANGIRRWFFVKNDSGENWEEFGYDSNYIYRNRDTSWANTCQNGAAAYYKVTDQDRSAFARWIPRYMNVGQTWTSPWSHFVDAGYKHNNDCATDSCTSQYEGWVQNRHQLVAHHSTYTTIWGYTVNDVIELTDPYNTGSDHFFYARGYGLVGFEGPAGNNEGRWRSGAYNINPDIGGASNWVGLCGEQLPPPIQPPPPPNPGTPPGDNLALGAADWSASSVYNADFGGDKATDGVIDAGSKWTSNGSSAESWLALDLGTNSDLTGFIVRHAGAGGESAAYNTLGFRLESGSSLSGPWTTLATVDNSAQQDSSTTVLANNVTTRYVRLYITNAGIDNYVRIPEFEVYGSVGSTPPPPTAGPLVNGGFEGAVQGNGVGQGWSSFSSSGDGTTYAVVSDPVYDGASAQLVVSPQPSTTDQYAGVYQVVAAESGSDYTVRAWNRTHFAGGSSWDHIARLGIDLTGGTDFQANSVEWYEFDSAKDTWHQLELNITATPSAITIFLQSWRKWASGGGSYTWFDHVRVETDGQTPPPPNPGTPGGDNLALTSASWSASSVYNADFGGDNATDGVISAGSKWTSDGSNAASWLALDLGTNSDITGFIVRHAGAAGESIGYNIQAFRLESGSSLSGPWTTLATVNNAAQQDSSTTVFTNTVTTRYVRLYVTDAGIDNYVRIPEFEVYGSTGSTPPPPSNNPPSAAATANPTSGEVPLTVSFNANGSSDPDGDSLSFSWNFGDGTQGSGVVVSHTYQTRGIYPATLTVDDGRGGSDDVTVTISVNTSDVPLPSYCPSTLDFPAIRAQLNQQGDDLAFVKIGFHVGPGGNQNGLGEWMTCLDAAGVPFFLKSADSAGQIWEAARLKAASGVPHVLVYRRSAGSGWDWDVPDYNKTPYDAAVEHWQRQRQEFPPELEPYKDLIWIETINEVDKNRSEWLAEFAYHTAQMAMDEGFNWAAFGWSAGEPEREHWEGPWMRQFLELAGNNPDRVAVALHEYSYVQDNLDRFYPNLVGRFQMLFDVCDTEGIARPKVLVTEFGWVYDDIADSVQQAMEVDLPWAAEIYADYPNVLGAAIWYLGPGFGGIANKAQPLIAPLTEYALQNYFVIPLESAPPPETGPNSITGGEPRGSFGSGGQTDEVSKPETWRWSEWFYGHQGIDQITWQADGCGVQHNYAIGWHGNDLVEYLMKFGGNYSRLTLRGLADTPGPVELEIYIDGNYAATAVWDNDNDCNQDAEVQIGGIPYGTHAIAVKFVNDHYDPGTGADRNFYLDGLRVSP